MSRPTPRAPEAFRPEFFPNHCGTVRIGCVAATLLFGAGARAPEAVDPAAPSAHRSVAISLDDRVRELEANLIRWALKASNGNKSKAAELLQVKRSTLGDRIKHCGLEIDHHASAAGDATA